MKCTLLVLHNYLISQCKNTKYCFKILTIF
uniref:Uncharacterized protein n=1 Tax=Siphoviridae sp. ct6DP12 TaxID=2827782 RepID=A0A8S5SA16_9CAUD|nr:MAG TPA: hypothetical protein [Siphoviridae sp. ct6DP12]